MKKIVLILLFSLIGLCCIAQDKPENTFNADKAVFVELLGSGIVYSVNAEQLFPGPVAVRVGAGFTDRTLRYGYTNAWIIPVSAAYLFKLNEELHVESGLSSTFIWEKNDFQNLSGPVLGIRRQDFEHGGAFIRLTFTPLIDFGKNLKYFLMGVFQWV